MITQLLFLQIITFLGIVIVLRLLFHRNLSSALKRLKELHEENLIKETQLKEELERAKKEKAAEVEKGKEEAKKIIEEAKKAGEILKRNLEDQGRQAAEKFINNGKEELAKLKKELIDNAESSAIELSLKMIKYIFTSQTKEHLHYELIEEVIGEIEGLEKERFSVKEEKVKVVSSYPLKEEEKTRLREVLASKLDENVTLEEEVNPEIIGGLIVEIGAFVIDGSLRNKLQKAIPLIKEKRSISTDAG
jgi:F-type H+-transporting ATPase subunit b